MDKDLLRLYAEYEKYNTELPWLRNEYIFLVEGIEKQNKELSIINASISSNKNIIETERGKLLQDKEDFEEAKKSEWIVRDNKKKTEQDDINNTIKQKQEDMKYIDNQIKEKQTELERLSKEVYAQEKKLELLKIENAEYSDIIKKQTDENKNSIEQLKIENENINEKIKEFETKQEEYKRQEEIFIINKENNTKDIKKLQEMSAILETKSLDINKTLELIHIKEEEQNNARKSAEATKNQLDEKLSTIEWKEMEIAKIISDFQEEKYRFLVIMKQRDIKKTDLDKLDKDFNL